MSFYAAVRLDFSHRVFTYIEENDVVLIYNNTNELHSFTGSEWRDNHFELFLQLIKDYKFLEINRNFSVYPDNFLKIYPKTEIFETKTIKTASKTYMSMS